MLQGKRILITGVINEASIATSIARVCHKLGAELVFTYQNDKARERVVKLADSLGSALCLPCDVSSDEQLAAVGESLQSHWPEGLDGAVHSIAYAPTEDMRGDFLQATSRQGFGTAHEISAYSFVALAKVLNPQLREGASLLTLTYHGSERVVSSYNLMGVAKASLEATTRYLAASMGQQGHRVNALSSGPLKTSAAIGTGKFRKLMAHVKNCSMIQRTLEAEEVANVAAFLLSDMASGVTGATIYADLGFHISMIDTAQIS